jgi:signal transduction histidine kinase
MRLYAAIPLVAALANLVIGAAVLTHGFRERLARAFTFLSLCLMSWNLGIFALYHFEDPVTAEWWSRVFRTGIVFAPAAAFHTAILLSKQRKRLWSAAVSCGYGLSAVLAVLNAQGKLVSGLSHHYWGWYIVGTPLYNALTLHVVAFTALSVERTAWAYRHPHSPRARAQAKFWFLAFALATGFMLTNVAVVYGANVYPLGNLGNVIYAGIMAYAIVRHRLMDVDYIVRKFVSFTAALTITMLPGGVGLYELAQLVGAEEPSILVLAAVALALTGIILVPTLQTALESRVQQAFFPRRYDYRQRLRHFSANLVHVFDEKALIRQLGDTLSEILDVEFCRIYLDRGHEDAFEAVYPPDDPGAPLPPLVVHACRRMTEPLLVNEMDRLNGVAAKRMRDENVEVILPLRIEDRVTGVVLMARNRDFLLISSEDLQLLATVAASASVALENCRLSHELRRSEAVLARANRLSSIGTLAAGIAHEIRNPLTAVKTFLDLLPERHDDRAFVDQFRTLSLTELKRVTDLINDLLAIGRSTTTQRVVVSLNACIEPVVRLLESQARNRQVKVVFEADQAVSSVHADADQLKQIVLNLILNAIDASPPETTVTVRTFEDAEGPAFEVEDQGVGIPKDRLDDVFEPFYTTKKTGTGLGLALVHQMIVEHGGTVTVDSEVGHGTVFQVFLPRADDGLRATGT